VIYQDETGASHGNDWASGFVEGMSLRNAGWKPLLDDDDHAGSLIPIFALAHEHDPDPRIRPYAEPMSAEQRENLISGCIAGLVQIHRYFLARRSRAAGHAPARRSGAKVGRNDPCPCGSGKKYKHCCGASPLH